MPGWISDFIKGPGMGIAIQIWNLAMGAISELLLETPATFSYDTWIFVRGTIYPWMLAIGVSLLNLFILIAVFQALVTLHNNITLEMCIEALIKIVAANVIYLNLMRIMQQILRIARFMCMGLDNLAGVDLRLSLDDEAGQSGIFGILIGFLFCVTAAVCAIMMLMTVYGRFIKLYLLLVMAPFAVAPLVGGQKTEHSFHAFVRTFLLNTFEIVVIQTVLIISTKLMQNGVSIFDGLPDLAQTIIGAGALNALFTMILTTAMVKGANSFLSKAFGL